MFFNYLVFQGLVGKMFYWQGDGKWDLPLFDHARCVNPAAFLAATHYWSSTYSFVLISKELRVLQLNVGNTFLMIKKQVIQTQSFQLALTHFQRERGTVCYPTLARHRTSCNLAVDCSLVLLGHVLLLWYCLRSPLCS